MTEPSLPESTYAVLGLVDKVPDSSGYDLASVASISFALFWPVSRTLLYRELERLTELEWVDASPLEQPTRRASGHTERPPTVAPRWLDGCDDLPTPSDRPATPCCFDSSSPTGCRTAPSNRCWPHTERSSRPSSISYSPSSTSWTQSPPQRPVPAASVTHHGITTTHARLEWTTDAERQLTDRDNSRRRSEAKSE